MIVKVRIPKLDANIEEVTVTRWAKREGEAVRRGEVLAEITTDKTAIEFEAPCSGMLRRLLVREKSIVPVGFVVALIGDAGGVLPDVSEENARLLAARREAVKTAPKIAAESREAYRTRVRATPAARRLAREQELDLAAVQAATGAEVVTESVLHAYRARKNA